MKKTEANELVRFATKDPIGKVDKEQGVIHGVAIIELGEAKGHGLFVDETMLEQVLAAGTKKEPIGLKSRFDHPSACSRSVGTFTGRFHNFRRDENKIRADLHLADVAAKSPDGDLRTYILDLAAEDPDAFGTSIVFKMAEPETPDPANKGKDGFPGEDDPFWNPHARLAALHHCDIVDEGAATNGLFGRPDYIAEQMERFAKEHPGAIGRILSGYKEWKIKKETEKMADRELKVVEAELVTALADGKVAVEALAVAKTEIESLKTGAETAKVEATEAGKVAGFALAKARLEQFKNPAFVLETLELSDADASAAYIKAVQSGGVFKDGEKPIEFTEGDGGGSTEPKEKFEDKVSAKMAEGEGCTRGQAISFCAREFKDLHEDYIERSNKPTK